MAAGFKCARYTIIVICVFFFQISILGCHFHTCESGSFLSDQLSVVIGWSFVFRSKSDDSVCESCAGV